MAISTRPASYLIKTVESYKVESYENDSRFDGYALVTREGEL